MRDETLAGFLRQLAARTSTPGGGAVAALHAAQAAAGLTATVASAAGIIVRAEHLAAEVREVLPR